MTAAPEVLSLLATSGLPPEAQAFLAAVSEGEAPTVAGQSAFNILYSGGILVAANPNVVTVGRWRYWMGPLTAFPAWGGAKLTNGLISTAAGFAQDTHTTFEDNAGFGITAFDPQSQIIFNWKLAQDRFAAKYPSRPLLSVLQGSDTDRLLVHTYLGATWPGGCDSGFVKRYAANLAALQAPAPPPVPPPVPTPPAPDTYTGTLTDSSGKSLPVSITIGAVTAIALVAAMMAPKPAQPPIQALPLPAAAEAPIGQEVRHSGFDFSSSTFVFDRNLRPVPIVSGMGRNLNDSL